MYANRVFILVIFINWTIGLQLLSRIYATNMDNHLVCILHADKSKHKKKIITTEHLLNVICF